MKITLVHDWLYHMRGGEKVLEALAELFPEATIYTLFSSRESLSPTLQRMRIKNSFLQLLPGIRSFYPWLLPLLPLVIRTLRIKEADLVISSSHCVAKGIGIPRGAAHVCYCHTPMRYLWGFEKEYFHPYPAWLLKIAEPVFSALRNWDKKTNEKVDYFFCNSETVRERIRRIYGREAVVIPPPVDSGFFTTPSNGKPKRENYYLVVSALTPYKRIDLAIEAFNHWDRPLWIAGDGPLRSQLVGQIRSSNIRFLGKVSDEELKVLYAEARALIFPQVEDFGIVPLEAQACGTPVIALGQGGALETVKEGIFFYEQTPQAIRQAVVDFEAKEFDPVVLRSQALMFDREIFKTKMRQAIENVIH